MRISAEFHTFSNFYFQNGIGCTTQKHYYKVISDISDLIEVKGSSNWEPNYLFHEPSSSI